MPKSSKIWGMGEINLFTRMRKIFGSESHNVELKQKYTDSSMLNIDTDVDIRYAPTEKGKNFLDTKSAYKAFRYLQDRYETLSEQEHRYYDNPPSVPNFPRDSVEYSMQLDRYTMHMQNRLGRFNQLRKEGIKLLEELKKFNQIIQFDQVNGGQAGRIRQLKAIDILDNATTIAFLKSMPINLHEDMTIDEKSYWNR